MADENYKRLSCADCSAPFVLQAQRGRSPTRCEKHRRKYHKKTVYTTKECKWCKAEMRGTEKNLRSRTYCSKECHDHGQRQRNTNACQVCHKEFHRRRGGAQMSKGVPARYCSNACKFFAQRLDDAEVAKRQADASRLKALREIIRAIGRVAKAKELPPRFFCIDCKKEHTPRKKQLRTVCAVCLLNRKLARAAAYRKARAGTATRRAERSKAKAIRRARMRISAESFDPLKVFERDGWRCQLCGVRTPKRLRGSYHGDAPELDHVIALSQGGSHTWANVQCACRACNIAKGSKARGQLGLDLSGGTEIVRIESPYDTAP